MDVIKWTFWITGKWYFSEGMEGFSDFNVSLSNNFKRTNAKTGGIKPISPLSTDQRITHKNKPDRSLSLFVFRDHSQSAHHFR